jgi:hypothetical protein
MSDNIELLHAVALTEDVPERGLRRGQVGTVVELLAPEVYEVELATTRVEPTLCSPSPHDSSWFFMSSRARFRDSMSEITLSVPDEVLAALKLTLEEKAA